MDIISTNKIPQVRQRTNLKAQLTRFCTYFDRIRDVAINDLIFNQLNSRLSVVEPSLSEFFSIQDEIDEILINNIAQGDDATNQEKEIVLKSELERSEFENKYFDILGQVKAYIAPYENDNRSQSSVRGSAQNSQMVQPRSSFVGGANSGGIKLPSLNLPMFAGQYDQWRQFFDTFSALIDSDASLTNIQKFYYLKSCLKNEATGVVDALEVTDANYPIAWQLLQERFENKKIITNNHLKAIFDIPVINKESHSALRGLYDSFNKNIRCLGSLGLPVQNWDTLLIFIIVSKLDSVTRRAWEQHGIAGDLPTLEELFTFLKKRCEVLETIGTEFLRNERFPIVPGKQNKKPLEIANTYFSSNHFSCHYCKGSHNIYNCDNFLKLSTNERINEAKKLNFCLNCLRKNHTLKDCKSGSSCRKCQKRHHTLLHIDFKQNSVQSCFNKSNPEFNVNNHNKEKGEVNNKGQEEETAKVSVLVSSQMQVSHVILATALVQVPDHNGILQSCRVLLDSASQSNFVTEETCKRLNLKTVDTNCHILGINKNESSIRYKTNLTIVSNHNAFEINLSCLILKNITEPLPSCSFNASMINIPQTIRLADPSYYIKGNIDILVGASVFWNILCAGQINLGPHLPVIQKTKLGWVLSGDCSVSPNYNPQNSLSYFCSEMPSLENQVNKFWELEEVQDSPTFSKQEYEVENHFVENISRSSDGRFIVKIPFNQNLSNLGESRMLAFSRYENLEKRLSTDPDLSRQYNDFLVEYEKLGHMTEIKEGPSETAYYLPHHCVVKPTSTTTKVRVVFDASSKTDTGLSLNDVQAVGPTIQGDLFTLLIRFRKFPFVLTADIEKMYRQVLLHEDDKKYHRIFWRRNSAEEISCFQLNTITYGTASASFLATRCLKQVADDHQIQEPAASRAIAEDFYMDDLLTGAFSKECLKALKQQVCTILKTGGFNLRKFLSNEPSLSDAVANDRNLDLQLDKDHMQTKTLGVCWDNTSDVFRYSINNFKTGTSVTKRTILSTTAQIFDPLGLLSPIIVNAKLILQELWQIKLSWDESIPLNLHTLWLRFGDQLSELSNLKVPRCVFTENATLFELHGFADASERAYGACLYIRSVNSNGEILVNLLCAKSRVAPLKRVSLPRLELCAAFLLANLIDKVRKSIQFSFTKTYLYTDSTITLCWLRAAPQRWKTFVANRVSEIQSLTSSSDWHHVSSANNPADFISRGTTPRTLLNSSLWWRGPSFLLEHDINSVIDKVELDQVNVPEAKLQEVSLVNQVQSFDLFSRFSTFTRLQRVVSWCFRFLTNAKVPREQRSFGCLSVQELNNTTKVLIGLAQSEKYSREINSLKQNLQLNNKSEIISLRPILVSNVLRVGGRLENSGFPSEKIHPIILPKGHQLTKLIVKHEHVKLLHCGPQHLLSSLRQRFWPIGGRDLVRQTIHNCITCSKYKPKGCTYVMGSLPKSRFDASFPFQNVGIDYAGPFITRDRKTRPYKEIKSYSALFVCLLTKAVHIELVSDLTTASFLAALRRFIARRGKPNTIFSDNGTNFVGANSKLLELTIFLQKKGNQNDINDFLSQQGVVWKFIPPSSPHFGGIWEAGVKSMKNHLVKIIGSTLLSFEELQTILIQIEAVLNSRPLFPLSPDPTDLNPITPAHFLIGRPVMSIPDEDLRNQPENRLQGYKKLQRLYQLFWDRWSKDYISNLQTRTKWKTDGSHIKLGMLVLVKDDHLPPLYWKLGRIVECHPGSDGVIRVVTVQCATNKYKRPVTKICLLPIDSNPSD